MSDKNGNKQIPPAPVLANLDQETFAIGWAHGWSGNTKDLHLYEDWREPEAIAYAAGTQLGIWMRSLERVAVN
jgi:hypothetical protein